MILLDSSGGKMQILLFFSYFSKNPKTRKINETVNKHVIFLHVESQQYKLRKGTEFTYQLLEITVIIRATGSNMSLS